MGISVSCISKEITLINGEDSSSAVEDGDSEWQGGWSLPASLCGFNRKRQCDVSNMSGHREGPQSRTKSIITGSFLFSGTGKSTCCIDSIHDQGLRPRRIVGLFLLFPHSMDISYVGVKSVYVSYDRDQHSVNHNLCLHIHWRQCMKLEG
ncbi:hypothetical protein CRENBAI_013157 [Crenichthys baileyi]|uniref:Uncharacterized protein n=1 Tax=Crenichthys baileyi TaxID=28760 RepID=A0AAV9RTF6_9TELE